MAVASLLRCLGGCTAAAWVSLDLAAVLFEPGGQGRRRPGYIGARERPMRGGDRPRLGEEASMSSSRGTYANDASSTDDNKLLRTAAAVVGAVFILVGILGFVPGITTGLYDQLDLFGNSSDAKLLGLFEVSGLHNIVHLVYGVAGLAMAKTAASARTYLIGGGVIYLVLWVYGLVVDERSAANFVPLNDADDWLHLGLGLGMIALGLLLSRANSARTATAR